MTTAEKREWQAIRDKVDDPEKAQALYLRWKAQTDLYFLGTEIFGWKNAKSTDGKRKRIDPKFHRWLARIMQTEEDCLIMVARKHLKTTWKKAKIVQSILNYPNRRRGLFSVTPRLVRLTLADIAYLLANPILLKLFPDVLRPPGKDYRNWNKFSLQDGELTVHRDSEFGYIPAEPQITALGNLAKVAGLHIDECHPDDIIDDSTVRSASLMEKSEDWWGYMQSVLEDDGYTQMTGTFYHYSDLYNKIVSEKHFPKDRIFIRPAIVNGEITYKSWFTKRMLEKIRRRSGPYRWACQYMLDPVPRGEEVFPPPQPTFCDLPTDEYKYYITVDPAPTTHDYSDKTGVVIAAVNRTKQVFIVEAQGFRKRGDEIAKYLIQKCVQYKPVRVGIEFGIQVELGRTIQTVRSEYENRTRTRVQMPIEAVPVSSRVTKLERVNMWFGAHIRLGKVKIHESCVELLRQMDLYTGRGGKEMDDLVDAASMLGAVIDGFAHNPIENIDGFVKTMTMRDLFNRKESYAWTSEFANYNAAN